MDFPGIRLVHGDCRLVLRSLEDESVDAVCTDPPAGIEFMGQEWDRFETVEENPSGPQTDTWHDNGGKNPYARGATPRYQGKTKASLLPFQDFIAEVFEEVYRVLKPGGHCLVWALPRTSHHTAMGVERAGFEVRDVITHHFGTGFPKSRDIAKDMDKRAGAERQVVETVPARSPHAQAEGWGNPGEDNWRDSKRGTQPMDVTVPATPEAERWAGWGTALKPATEHWILARKPVDGTVAHNVLVHGPGAINIDGCRIGNSERPLRVPFGDDTPGKVTYGSGGIGGGSQAIGTTELGRWPANLVLSHSPDCEPIGEVEVRSDGHHPARRGQGNTWAGHHGQEGLEERKSGTEIVEAWNCAPDCPVAELDRQSGTLKSGKPGKHRLGVNTSAAYGTESRRPGTAMTGYGDVGGASRFFYVAKASRSERNAGLGDDFEEKPILWSSGTQNPGSFQAAGTKREVKNNHPTVKSVALMRWLCRLITPPGGTVLDCFLGSGTTGVACVEEGFGFIGIENKAQYLAIADARIAHAIAKREASVSNQASLFEGAV